MPAELHLIAAGFEQALARHDPDRRLPMLERWLARGAHRVAAAPASYGRVSRWQAMLLESVDPALDPADFASAPVSWLGSDGGAFDGVCLHADPVYIETLMDRLRLATTVVLEAATATQLGEALASQLDSDGHRFATRGADRWFVCVPGRLDAQTVPLESALGTDLRETQPTGPDASVLRRLMNEAQMLLHAQEINVTRAGAGRPPVNGVWLWGGGTFPARSPSTATSLLGDDPYVCGLARLQGCPPRPAVHAGLAEVAAELSRIAVAVRVQDLAEFEHDWLVPLTDDLASGRYARVVLGLEGRWVSVTGRQLRRFWKRGLDLAAWRA